MRLREREARDDFVHLHLPHTSLQQQSHTHTDMYVTHSQNCINKRSFFFARIHFCLRRNPLCGATAFVGAPTPLPPPHRLWLLPSSLLATPLQSTLLQSTGILFGLAFSCSCNFCCSCSCARFYCCLSARVSLCACVGV